MSLGLYAQSISNNNITRLEPVGAIPADLQNIIKGCNFDGSVCKTHYQRYQNDYIRSLLLSSQVLYGDEVTLYLNKILGTLLQNDKVLKDKIKLYCLKSEITNAFSTADGFVFVSMGLVSQCSNEAELAFTLAHEVAHYVKRHGVTDKDQRKANDDIDNYLSQHARSREQELEADSLGYEIYSRSPYALGCVVAIFDVLQYGYLPFDEIDFGRNIFENEYYKFNDKYFLESVTPITLRESSVDTFSTHPNIAVRKEAISKRLNEANVDNNDCQEPSAEFLKVRQLARYEVIREQISNDNYLKALYNILVLQHLKDTNPYLNVAKSAALYGIASAKISGNYSMIDIKKEKTEGEFQRIVHLFKQMSKNECAVLSLRTSYQAMQGENGNNYLSLLFNDIVHYLSSTNNLNTLNKFSDYAQGETIVEDTATKADTTKSKYDKVKAGKKVANQQNFKTENYMLADLKRDSTFVAMFNNALVESDKKQASSLISSLSQKPNTVTKDTRLIVLKPTAVKYYDDKTAWDNGMELDKYYSKKLEKRVESIAKECGFETMVISRHQDSLPCSYQLFSRLNDYSKSLNQFSDITFESYDIADLSSELGSSTINLVQYSRKKAARPSNVSYKFLHTIASIFTLPTMPISIYQWVFTQKYSTLDIGFFDFKANKTIYRVSNDFITEGSKDQLNQELYECYSRLQGSKDYGYLGRRFNILLDVRFSPAFMAAYSDRKGILDFSYILAPSVEYTLNKKVVLGANAQFQSVKFNPKRTSGFYGVLAAYPETDLNLWGIGVYTKLFPGDKAPIGYYYKFQADMYSFSYDIPTYRTGSDFTFGLRVEFGKNIMLTKRLSLGTGFSCGLLTSGYGFISKDVREIAPSDCAKSRLLSGYMIGVNLSLGFLAF